MKKHVVLSANNPETPKKSRLSMLLAWANIVTQVAFPMSLAYTPAVMAAKKAHTEEEQATANAATRLAGVLASGDPTKQAESIARGAATSSANTAVENWLNQVGSAKVQLNVDDKLTLEGSQVDVLLPLQDTPSLLTFSQLGMRYINDRLTLNAGIGQRHFLDQQMFGYNLFLDRDVQGRHSRIGLGGEYARDYLRIGANGYFGATGWKNSRDLDGFDEKAANGFDIRTEAYLPALPQLGGKLVYEHYFGDEVGLFGKDNRQSDPSAFTVGVNYSPIPLVTLGADHKRGNSGMEETRFNLSFNYALGTPLSQQLDPANVGAKRTLAGSRYELVDRNNEIVLQYREQQLLNVVMAPLMQGDSGQTIALPITVTSKHGVASFEWQADGFTAAGGKIMPKGQGWQAVLPAYSLQGNNSYPISVTVVDKAGNRSAPAQGEIAVTGFGIAATSELTIKNARLPADGRSTTQVELSLKDGSGSPISGIAGQITLDSEFQAPSVANKISPAAASAQQPTPHTIGEITESPDRPGVYLATFTAGSKVGVVKLSANITGATLAVKPATVTLAADNTTATLDKNSLSGKDGSTLANGKDVNTVQLPVKDANGNPIPGYDVTFTVTNPDGTTRQQTVTTDENGIASLPVTSNLAGSVKVEAEIGGLTSSTELSFVADSTTATIDQNGMGAKAGNTVANGTDVNTVQLPVKDANGNPIPGFDVTFTITNPDGSTRQQTVKTDENGIASLPVTSDKAGNVKVEANVGGVTNSTELSFVADSSTAKIEEDGMTAATGNTVANGSDSNTVQLPVKDANGNPIPGFDVTFTVTNPDGSTRQETVTTDANGIASLPVTSDKAGSVKVEANVGGITSSTELSFVADSSTAKIDEDGMTAAAGNTVANGTDSNTVQLPVKDANGNPIPGFDVTFTVTNPDGTTRQQTVTTDANGIASLPVTSDKAGSVKVEAEVGGVTTSTELSFIADSSTAKIDENGMTAAAGDTTANGSDVNTVQLPIKDANGNPIPGFDVTFTVTNPDGSTRQQTVTTDANGIASLPVTSDKAGSVKVEANVGGVTSSTELSFIADSSTAKIEEDGMTAATGNTVANGTDVNTVQLPVKDANGNPLPGFEVTFTVTNPDGSTRQQTVTTDANGIASLPVTSDKAGSVKVEAEVGGVTTSTELSFIADSGTAKIEEDGMTAATGNTVANGTDVNTVQLPVKDANGNPIPGFDVTFTVTNPDGTTRQETVTTDANGIASLPITSDKAGSVKVEAEVGGVTTSTELSFIADSSTAKIEEDGMTAATGNTVANGTDVNTVQLPVKDANGNPIPGFDVTFTVTNPDGTTRQQTVTTDANGIASLPVTSEQAGSVKVEAEVGGVTSSTELSFIADSSTAKIDENGMTAATGNTVANGKDVNTVQLPVKDANGNPIPGFSVTFTVTNPDGSTRQQTVTTDANGIASLPVTSDQAGSVKVEAEVGGVTTSTELSFVADSSTAKIEEDGMTAATGNTVANGTDVNTVQLPVKDANGNPIPGFDVTFTVTNPDGSTRQETVTTDANGIASLPVTSDKAGSVKVEAEVGGVTTSTELSFIADSSTAKIDENGMTAAAGDTTANGTDINTVQLPVKDANGNPIPGFDVTFTVTNPDGSTRQETVTTDANGIASLPVTSEQAGSVKVEAEVGGVTTSTELSFIADSSTAKIEEDGMTAATGNTVANGTDVNTVQLPVKDANGNPIPGFDVTFTVTNPDGSTRQETVTTDANGIASLPVTSEQAGSVKVEAEVGGVTSSTELSFVAGEMTAVNSSLETGATNIVANGTDTTLITLMLKDSNNNPVTGQNVTFSSTLGTLSSVTEGDNGVYTATLTAGVAAGITTLQASVGGNPLSLTTSVTLVPGAVGSEQSTLMPSKASINADDRTGSTLTLTAKDANGNAIKDLDIELVTDLADTEITAVVNNNDGTYTASINGTKAGVASITVLSSGVTLEGLSTAVTITPGAWNAAQSTPVMGVTRQTLDVRQRGNIFMRNYVTLKALPLYDKHGNTISGELIYNLSGAKLTTVTSVASSVNGTDGATIKSDGTATYSPANDAYATEAAAYANRFISTDVTVTVTGIKDDFKTTTVNKVFKLGAG
ncbi:Ig-like domain-containing protein [Serratia sp. UGAL515B_01]|uniref:Ig-like domain-containing protein n=1 Tax=Serratia sp. UGAL515B_01 TaxID=2986763 RepID=UPI0029534697|nr:Ig-like domain-containing protein [Serratia sp. UGAL515B_01]WON76424.1 Ig-like domain-containing protein [Serratia sp. UGAL515B_01]